MSRPVALVLRALGLGDFLTGLPALKLLRGALPGHRIVLAAPDLFASLAVASGSVDDVVAAHELDRIRDAPDRADFAVDLHGSGPARRELLLQHRPRRLVAFGPGGPKWRRDEHEVSRWCRLVSEGLGLGDTSVPGVRGLLPVPVADVLPAVTVVHPGAAASSRRWPATRFATVARQLRDDGHRVVITGGPGERSLADRVAAASGATPCTALTLPELLALVAHARLVLCGDTGVAHVASAYATPSVVLFGPVSPAQWGPPSDGPHAVLWHGDGRGDPHGRRPDPALLRINVDEALSACRRAPAPDGETAGVSRPAS